MGRSWLPRVRIGTDIGDIDTTLCGGARAGRLGTPNTVRKDRSEGLGQRCVLVRPPWAFASPHLALVTKLNVILAFALLLIIIMMNILLVMTMSMDTVMTLRVIQLAMTLALSTTVGIVMALRLIMAIIMTQHINGNP